MATVYAHSLKGRPREEWETLADHSAGVAALAGAFAEPLGWAEVLRLAGSLHDIGKVSPEFQAYIAEQCASGGDHSAAGARIALDQYGVGPGRALGTILAAIIAAHHAGLADGGDLNRRMTAAHRLVPAGWQHHVGPLPDAAALRPSVPPPAGGPKGFAWSFLIRMLFSCLVDADFVATESFYSEAIGAPLERGNHTELTVLRERLVAFMAEKRATAPRTPLNALRNEILDHAITKAALKPGLFSLTVPTGGGKTLASLSFALEHAVRHGLRRVIYVIPHTGAWIETIMRAVEHFHAATSPPTRGRGSKLRRHGLGRCLQSSPPTRGRGSKPIRVKELRKNGTSPPTRGRGSKRIRPASCWRN